MTVHELDPLTQDALAHRLAEMTISIPDDLVETASSQRRRPAAARRRRRRAAWLTAGLATLIAGNLGGAALVPGYARTLASAPGFGLIAGPALRAAGISAADVVPAEDAVVVDGFTVRLTGAYADGLRTTVFVSLPGDMGYTGLGPWLTDQFGERYSTTGGIGLGVGPYPVDFQPLRGRAALDGARFTFHVTLVDSHGHEHPVALEGTVSAGPVHSLPPPPPITSDGNIFAVASIRVSATGVEVNTRITGGLADDAAAKYKSHPMARDGGVSLPGVYLVTSDGTYEIPIAWSQDDVFDNLVKTCADVESRIFAKGPGPWRIVVSYDDPKPGARALASWTITEPQQ